MIIIPANTLSTSTGGFDVANSCRFNDGSDDSLGKSITGVNTTKLTISFWTKTAPASGDNYVVFASENNTGNYLFIALNDGLDIQIGGTANRRITTQRFRDYSAWYHIVCVFDTTQGTASDRIKIYVNGNQVTSFSINTTGMSQDSNLPTISSTLNYEIGDYYGQSGFGYDGYLAEFCALYGQALDPTSFGEFDDSGIWKPIDVSGLTFGTNGFYLDFEDSAALGDDVSGNGNDFTVNNLTAIDQATDTPTNNFATLNPLDAYWEASTFSEGNCKIVTESSDYSYNTSTIGLTTGKWYCEVYIEATPHTGTKDSMIGIAGRMSEASLGFIGFYNDTYGIYGGNGNIFNNNLNASYGVSHTTGDIIGIYLDLDNNKLYFAKNGTLMNSGTGKDITAVTNTKAGAYFMVAADFYNGASGTYRLNFGNPIYALSSANTDVNGFGSFEYNPSSGTFDGASKDFLAINTKNLAEYG